MEEERGGEDRIRTEMEVVGAKQTDELLGQKKRGKRKGPEMAGGREVSQIGWKDEKGSYLVRPNVGTPAGEEEDERRAKTHEGKKKMVIFLTAGRELVCTCACVCACTWQQLAWQHI